jgi:uncharacterized protein (UPF0335 family)
MSRVTSEEVTRPMPKTDDDSDDFLDTSPEKMKAAHNQQLRRFMERIERLEEEKKGIADDIRDVYAEAKANGYDTKIMRFIAKLRKMESHTRQEWDALIEAYRAELGL